MFNTTIIFLLRTPYTYGKSTHREQRSTRQSKWLSLLYILYFVWIRKEFKCSFLNVDGVEGLVIVHSLQILVAPLSCTGCHIFGMASIVSRYIDVLLSYKKYWRIVAEQDRLDTRVCWLHLTCLCFQKSAESWCRETWRTYRTSSSAEHPKVPVLVSRLSSVKQANANLHIYCFHSLIYVP